MGVERLAAIVQDVPSRSVYETDGYQAIMAWIEDESGVAWDANEAATKAHRVLADHGRGMTFLVGDGVVPSNEGRGYVLRRIIRRAVQQARKIGLDDLWRLSDVVVEQMSPWYPELEENRRQHPGRAARRRRSASPRRSPAGSSSSRRSPRSGDISGEDAFALTATYGFPIELTVELARERGLAVDEDGFGRLMEEHREISRAGGEKSELQRAADFARDAGFETDFVGWEKTEVLTQIGALEELGDGTFLAKLRESPFYPDGRRPGERPGLDRGGRTAAPTSSRPFASARTRRSSSVARASRPATASRRSSPGRSASRRWPTTRRRTCCTARFRRSSATTCGRRARPSAPTSSASTSPIRRR